MINKVTVIIPSYNHSMFIESAIMSVINQSYENIELIVIDDGSKDGSQDIIEKLSNKYKFKYISQENKGLAETLNYALSISSGVYVTTCSSDDYLHKDKISKQVEFLDSNHDYEVCYTGAYVVDDKNIISEDKTNALNNGLCEGYLFNEIFTFRIHLPVSFMYKKDFLIDIGAYKEGCFAEDFNLNLRISKSAKVGYIVDKLYYYRMDLEKDKSKRRRSNIKKETSDSHYETIIEYSEHPLYNEALSNWNYRRFCFFCGDKKNKKYALEGFILSCGNVKNILKFKTLKYLLVLSFYWK